MLDINDAILHRSDHPKGAAPTFAWDHNAASARLPSSGGALLELRAVPLPAGPSPASAPCDAGLWRLSLCLTGRGRWEVEVMWDGVHARPYDVLFDFSLQWDEGGYFGLGQGVVGGSPCSTPPSPTAAHAAAAGGQELRALCGPHRIESTFGWARFELCDEKVMARFVRMGGGRAPVATLRVACPSLAV